MMKNNDGNVALYEVANDENSINIRKYSNRLVMAGRAMIIFGLWSALRVLIYIFINMNDVVEQSVAEAVENVGDRTIVYAITVVIMILIFGIPFLFNLYLGRRAIREGRGGKKSTVYLVWTALYGVAIIATLIPTLFESMGLTTIAFSIVDITLCIACVDIMYSAIRLRHSMGKTAKEVE